MQLESLWVCVPVCLCVPVCACVCLRVRVRVPGVLKLEPATVRVVLFGFTLNETELKTGRFIRNHTSFFVFLDCILTKMELCTQF